MPESSKPSGEHVGIGVAPRLRSLRVAEDPDTPPKGGSVTPKQLTPTHTAGSLSDGDRSPLQVRCFSNDWQLPGIRSHSFTGLWRVLCIGLGILCLTGAAFYTGSALTASGQLSGGSHNSFGSEQSPDSQKIILNKAAGKGLDVAKEVAKVVSYASDKETKAQLRPKLTPRHPKIYIAELPPKYNTILLEAFLALGSDANAAEGSQGAASRLAKAVIENPLGSPIKNTSDGLCSSDPSSLDVLFFSALSKSPLREKNLTEADIVLVPFWVHKLVKLDKELEKPNRHDLAAGDFWRDVNNLLPALGQKPHVLVIPGKEADLRATCGGHGLDVLCNPMADKFTILTPEVLTGRPNSLTGAKVAPGMIGSLRETSDSVAVPDLGMIHFSQEDPQLKAKFRVDEIQKDKTKLLAESFRARAPIRKALKTQCLQKPETCLHSEPPALFQQHTTTNFASVVRGNNKAAWFCLQPPGDAAVRNALYDCLVTSAIPVIFDLQLPKILPFTHVIAWEKLLANISPDDILKSKQNVGELLQIKHSLDDRLARMAVLHTIRHLFQYSIDPAHYLVRFDQLTTVTRKDDAFTMSLKSLLRQICRNGHLQEKCS